MFVIWLDKPQQMICYRSHMARVDKTAELDCAVIWHWVCTQTTARQWTTERTYRVLLGTDLVFCSSLSTVSFTAWLCLWVNAPVSLFTHNAQSVDNSNVTGSSTGTKQRHSLIFSPTILFILFSLTCSPCGVMDLQDLWTALRSDS